MDDNGNVTIPETITKDGIEYEVTIDSNAFANVTGVTSVTVPVSLSYEDLVKALDNNSFSASELCVTVTASQSSNKVPTDNMIQCQKITEVAFANGIKEIEDYAFSNCPNLTTVYFPSTIEKIGENAFYFSKMIKKLDASGMYYAGSEETWNGKVKQVSNWQSDWPELPDSHYEVPVPTQRSKTAPATPAINNLTSLFNML